MSLKTKVQAKIDSTHSWTTPQDLKVLETLIDTHYFYRGCKNGRI